MERQDKNLAFMLQYENVAWYEDGDVRILDRRVYPTTVSFVHCKTHVEVMQAIRDMVTQSAGPFTAAAMGMALAAYECRDKSKDEQIAYLAKASDTISHARPTTVKRMQAITEGCLEAAKKALEAGVPVPEAIRDHAVETNNKRYAKIGKVAEYLVDMIPNNGTVLTQCFGETIVGQMLRVAKERGKGFKVVCAETRPYFQGARLTATVAHDMGFDTTVITDNMPAWYMEKEGVDVFTCAADAICLDGHIVNKVGTYQIAIVSKYMQIPMFVTGAPDRGHPDAASIHIEMRDPEFPLQAMGVRTAAQGVHGWYPSFDITPPHLVSGVVTDRGIYSPYDLLRYFDGADLGQYEMVV